MNLFNYLRNQAKRLTVISFVIVMGLITFGISPLPVFADNEGEAPPVLSGEPTDIPGQLLIGFRKNVPESVGQEITKSFGAQTKGIIHQINVHVVQLPEQASPQAVEAVAEALSHRPEVEFVEQDQLHPPSFVPNDPQYTNQWHLPTIQAPTAWNTTTGTDGVIIAIIDTGVDPTHPDLTPHMVPGWNFYDNNADTSDVSGHGTAVAGSAAAVINNGLGVAGVCGNCLLMPIRISDLNGNGATSRMASGLAFASDHGARVANISYRVSTSPTISTAAQYFQNTGGVVTISAGNQGDFVLTADNPYVLTISATSSSDDLASWTVTGNLIDLASPGVNIRTTTRGGSYGNASGTSFSAPITAGIAALLISANPNLAATQIQDILKQSADDLGPSGWDTGYGWGRVNAANAVAMAADVPPPTPDTTAPTVSMTSPVAGATLVGVATLSASASDNVGVSAVEFYSGTTLLGADNTTPYSMSWNTNSVGNGDYTLMAKAFDAAGNNATSPSVNVTVALDTVPPTVVITSPTNGSTIPNGNTTVNASATDASQIKQMRIYLNGTLKQTCSGSPCSKGIPKKQFTSGANTLLVDATDAGGNQNSASVTVYKP